MSAAMNGNSSGNNNNDAANNKSITYSSTRGCATQRNLSFRTVVMRGLAHDGGLFIPDSFPTVTPSELERWRRFDYATLATEVIGKFVEDDEVPRAILADIVGRSCAAFRVVDVTPLVKIDGHYILVSVWGKKGIYIYISSA